MPYHVGAVRPSGRRRVARLLACSILASGVALPGLAQAQDTPAPERLTLDGNGVDLSNGSFNFVATDISIGPDSPGGLAYRRIRGPNSSGDNFQGYVAVASGGTPAYVTIGQTSEAFDVSGGAYASRGTGSTLTHSGSSWTYKKADGTTYELFLDEPEAGNRLKGISSVTYPTGEKVTLTWARRAITVLPCTIRPCATRTYQRLSSVNNDAGYQLKFSYVGNNALSSAEDWLRLTQIQAINNAVDYCSPTATACTGLTGTWPSATYSQTSSGGVTTRQVVNDRGQTWIYTDGPGSTTIQRPSAASATTSVAFTGAKVSSLTREGATWSYGYVDDGLGNRTTTTTDPLGHHIIVKSVIADGRVLSSKDDLGNETTFTYDSFGRPHDRTDPEGGKVVYGYDTRGNVTSTTFKAKPSVGGTDIVLSAGFPTSCTDPLSCNKPAWTQDGKGNRTDYTYLPSTGLVATITRPAATTGAVRPQARFTYQQMQASAKNSSGSLVPSGINVYKLVATSECRTLASCGGTSDEVKSTFAYDGNLLVTGATRGAGDSSLTASVTAAYNPVGDLVSLDGPLPGSDDTSFRRYGPGRLVAGAISPDPDGGGALKRRAGKIGYNPDGQVASAEIGTVDGTTDADWSAFSSAQKIAITFDTAGRKATESIVAGSTTYQVTQFSYDADGRPDCTALRMNSATWGSLPGACTLATTGSAGPDRINRNMYDSVHRVTKVLAAYGTADQADEVTITYSSNGNLASVTDGESNKTSYEYDGFDRPSKTYYSVTTAGSGTSSTTDYEQLGYDAASNVTSRRLRDGQTITFGYDNLNRVTSKVTPGTIYGDWDGAYSYDLLGQLTNATGDGTIINAFSYDALGRLLTERTHNAFTYHAYDLAGRQTRLTWGDGFYVDYDYSVTGQVTAIRENGATSGAGVLATYSYDNLGRRTGVTRGNGTTTSYGYDGVSRLASLTQDLGGSSYDFTHGFSYTPAGQIASVTRSNDAYAWNGHYNVDRNYTVNGLNQMTAAGATSLGYDTRGNLTSSGASSYSYTVENRMALAPSLTMTYEPAAGQLLQVYNSSTGYDTRFAWSGGQMIAELTSGGAVTKRYVPGPGTDEPVVWYEGSGTSDRRWLHADERGSIVAVTNGSGTVLGVNSYDEYGIPGAGNIGRFQYTGQAWLPELGMYYYKARIYSPTLGRFMQTDPIGYNGGLNLYNYVNADPINFVDPSGLDDCPSGSVTAENRDESDDNGCEANVQVTGVPAMLAPWGALHWGTGNTSWQTVGDEVSIVAIGYRPEDTWAGAACRLGNGLSVLSDMSGTASTVLTGSGLVVAGAGAVTLQPEISAAGLAMVETGGALGNISAGSQIIGGLLQGISGVDAGYDNAWKGAVNWATGFGMGRLFGPSIPAGYRTVSQRRSDSLAKKVSTVAGGMFGVATSAIPDLGAETVICPR